MKSTKRIRPAKERSVPVALGSPIVKEELPLPFVHYPNHYGAFIGFSEENDSKIFFCRCAMPAIENHFLLNEYELRNNRHYESISPSNSGRMFPIKIASKSLNDADIKSIIIYKEKICHRCNMATPSLRYCDEMYGGNFKQYFGWYIRQTALRLGIKEPSYLPGITPDHLIKMIKEASRLIDIRSSLTKNYDHNRHKILALEKEEGKLKRKLNKEIENITRVEFGFRKVGDGNVSETILTKIVSKIYLNEEILKHYRPKWLEGLELDIYIPTKKIGIEYQGQQHFHPIKAWGGKKALEKLRERDQKKRRVCKENNVILFEFDYTEPLEYNYIKNKINP